MLNLCVLVIIEVALGNVRAFFLLFIMNINDEYQTDLTHKKMCPLLHQNAKKLIQRTYHTYWVLETPHSTTPNVHKFAQLIQ